MSFVVNFGNLQAELRVERSVEPFEYDIPENYTFIDIGLEIHNQLQVFGIYNVDIEFNCKFLKTLKKYKILICL